MNEDTNRKKTDNPNSGTDDFVRGAVGEGGIETHKFGELQDETDEIGIEGLLEDPEYLDFLDSFGEFEMEEDSVGFDELVEESQNGDHTGRFSISCESDTPDHAMQPAGSDAIDELIETLTSEGVSEDQQAQLREILGIKNRRRMEVQLNHLKSRFLDLEAYIQAMEDLFDADTDLLSEIDEIENELSEVRDQMKTQADRLDGIEQELETLATDQKLHEDELTSVEESLNQTKAVLRQNFSTIESELKTAKRWRAQVREAFESPDRDGKTIDADESTFEHRRSEQISDE